jgi:hypothetical protein
MNLRLLKKLFKPLDYLRIRHHEKSWYDFYIPLLIGIGITVALYLLPLPIKTFGKSGLIELITGILQILTGFYIASLAAVSTFKSEGMDDPIKGDSITLKIKIRDKKVDKPLTRRDFLCYLFGYLTLLSLTIYFLGGFSNLLVVNFKFLIPISYHICVKWSFVLFFLILSSNLIITTLFGLFYLVDRIHRK